MNIKNVTLEVDSLEIVGHLYLPRNVDMIPYSTVCICHGIPEKTSAPGDRGYPLLAENICRQGFAVFIFNFRGTGVSDGNFDILGWTRDLEVVIDYLCAEVYVSKISLMGFSGGAAVAVYVASRDKRISSIVACSCPAEFSWFNGIDDPQPVVDYFRDVGIIRDEGFPPSVDEWLAGFRLVSPVKYIAGISTGHLLLMHGSLDETVDVSNARKLYAAAREPKQLIIVDGAGHRLRRDDSAMASAIEWLKFCAKIDG